MSRSSRTNPVSRLVHLARSRPGGGPPNNWLSNFGGSAWELDATTGQYYYHSFLKSSPTSTGAIPEYAHAMLHVLRFWLDRGVDGFRVDVLWMLIKDDQFRDNPPNPATCPARPRTIAFCRSTPRIVPRCTKSSRRCAPFSMPIATASSSAKSIFPSTSSSPTTARDLNGAQSAFQLSASRMRRGTPKRVAEIIHNYEAALPAGAWPNWVLGNHDKPRIATRIGAAPSSGRRDALLTLRGTPTMYYGEEIGMTDVAIPPDEIQDPAEKNEPGHRPRPRSRAHSHALGRFALRRFQPRETLAASRPRSPHAQRLRRNAPTQLRCSIFTASSSRFVAKLPHSSPATFQMFPQLVTC